MVNDTAYNILIITQIITGLSLILSEALGLLPQFKENSITEVFICRCMGHDWFIKKVQPPSQNLPNIVTTDGQDEYNQTTSPTTTTRSDQNQNGKGSDQKSIGTQTETPIQDQISPESKTIQTFGSKS
jgi:hypothetical protein